MFWLQCNLLKYSWIEPIHYLHYIIYLLWRTIQQMSLILLLIYINHFNGSFFRGHLYTCFGLRFSDWVLSKHYMHQMSLFCYQSQRLYWVFVLAHLISNVPSVPASEAWLHSSWDYVFKLNSCEQPFSGSSFEMRPSMDKWLVFTAYSWRTLSNVLQSKTFGLQKIKRRWNHLRY